MTKWPMVQPLTAKISHNQVQTPSANHLYNYAASVSPRLKAPASSPALKWFLAMGFWRLDFSDLIQKLVQGLVLGLDGLLPCLVGTHGADELHHSLNRCHIGLFQNTLQDCTLT
jgi:hypothetical protein